ncbi:hypothetical protein DV515_00002254 [Chloebia gouldiae]|uniref:Uncharacterized protein n=1 Tax=Chloebia gouldiae TaxID=44316 RepID=A0A3L8T0I6_CHLGU|nr:hypothetical protein DV515_00002254 [Chloebia gouldiae]
MEPEGCVVQRAPECLLSSPPPEMRWVYLLPPPRGRKREAIPLGTMQKAYRKDVLLDSLELLCSLMNLDEPSYIHYVITGRTLSQILKPAVCCESYKVHCQITRLKANSGDLNARGMVLACILDEAAA